MVLRTRFSGRWRRRLAVGISTIALSVAAYAAPGANAADPDKAVDRVSTATPIKHVIVVIAENASFDHVYGTYQPRHDQHVANLLSRCIVRADGTSGPNSRYRRSPNISSARQRAAKRPM
jgi:phospholipase C